jgi:hypothetical protein
LARLTEISSSPTDGPEIFVLVVSFLIVMPRDGIFRISESLKYGNYPIDLCLSGSMSHSTTDGTRGPDQCPIVTRFVCRSTVVVKVCIPDGGGD